MSVHERVTEVPQPQWSYHVAGPFLPIGAKSEPIHVPLQSGPCYPHSRPLVTSELAALERAFPLPRPPRVYLPHFDGVNGTNGACFNVGPPDGRPGERGHPVVVLFGKPTPIHPAVTRYLMAHEYGHAVFEYLDAWRGRGEGQDLLTEYLNLRGLPRAEEAYGPGTWHRDPHEIFANDFRLLVAQVEVDFWPHHTIRNPMLDPHLSEWWSLRATDAKEYALAG